MQSGPRSGSSRRNGSNSDLVSRKSERRRLFFVFFLVVAAMGSVIAAMAAAILESNGMGMISAAALTFVTMLTLSMTAYLFLEHQSHDI